MKFKSLPTQSQLTERLIYNPVTGDLFWRRREDRHPSWNARYAGQVAGYTDEEGYVCICLKEFSGNYYTHRIAWVLHNGACPEITIDHMNGKRADNRIVNLRLATHSQQQQNKKNTGDYPKGVTKANDKFRASIVKDGRKIHLGHFKTVSEASDAYRIAAFAEFQDFVCLER